MLRHADPSALVHVPLRHCTARPLLREGYSRKRRRNSVNAPQKPRQEPKPLLQSKHASGLAILKLYLAYVSNP